jgi:uncharacterized membrane protein required for colicin V production
VGLNAVDWIAIAIVAVAAAGGLRRGFVLSAFSLVGLGVGAYVGSRVAPHLLDGGSDSRWTPFAGLIGAVVGAVLFQFGALTVASFIRGGIRVTPLRVIDSAGGLVLGGIFGVVIVVLVGASVTLLNPGETALSREVERSAVVKRFDSALPPRTLLNLLARIDPIPSVIGPSAPTLPPSKGVLRDPSIRAATTRVVKVLGTACGVGIEGTGWVAGRNLIVTAAHVVAGEQDTIVLIPGRALRSVATVVALDIHNDVAVLRVSGLDLKPLQLADPQSGASVAILGYPLDGNLTAAPGRIGKTAAVLTQDALQRGPVTRSITAVAGRIQHGDSGGPAVDTSGRVQSMIFAARRGAASGYGVPPAIIRDDLARVGTRAVDNTACAP